MGPRPSKPKTLVRVQPGVPDFTGRLANGKPPVSETGLRGSIPRLPASSQHRAATVRRREGIGAHSKISRQGAKSAKQTRQFLSAYVASWRENPGVPDVAGRSANGKPPVFETGLRGSIPRLPARLNRARSSSG